MSDIKKCSKLDKSSANELAERLNEQNGDDNTAKANQLNKELKKLKKRDIELDAIMKKLYEDSVTGKLADEMFSKFLADYQDEQVEARIKIEQTEKEISEIKSSQKDTDSWIKLIKKYSKIDKLDRTILSELVDKITVSESREIDGVNTTDITIYYRFIGNIN